ncbi:hypothetical protein M8C21_030393, partial [Ambrosia artemisiifolia]
MEYMQLKSNVNLSNFVSVKLSGHNNYRIWKDQMRHLLQSHSLLHIIDEEARSPQDKDDPMTKKYNRLVRDETEDLKYMEASNVNVSNFVSVNLSNDSNYSIWRAQMLYLLESHSLLHIITDIHGFEKVKYHKLVNGWILRTMNDELLKEFPAEDYIYIDYSANYLWEELESRFTKGYSRPEPIVSASTQDLKYTQALNVNVSNFVTAKLSGRSNYRIWKGQMLCLIESQRLLHIIDKEGGYEVGKYDTLVKGWIFSTMNEQLLSDLTFTDDLVGGYNTAKDVWEKLTSAFDRQDAQEVEFGIEFVKDDTKSENDLLESDNTDKKRWYKAVAEGCWKKARSIFKVNKNVATEATTANENTNFHVAVERESSGTEVVRDTPDVETGNSRIEVKELYEAAAKGRWRKAKSILRNSETASIEAITTNGNTILHVAVERGQNHFVEELLGFLKNGEDIEKKNEKGRTALHIAAMVGNTNATQLLVQKREELLGIEDDDKNLPLHLASEYMNLNIYAYLVKQSLRPSYSDFRTYLSHRATIVPAIFSKQYDLAETLLKDLEEIMLKRFPMLPNSKRFRPYEEILMAITISYPTDIGFMESFIYPSFQNVCQKTIVRVRPIKNIEKKKKEYKDAKRILSLMRKSNIVHNDSLFEAVRLDIHEVVDEILFTSPATINCKDEEGYNIIQSSILNRAEKVYNLIYHIIERTKSHREMTDSFSNNLGHLCGKLAPSFVLGRTTGAALQLQRELIWFKWRSSCYLYNLRKKNIYKETPAMVFTREHRDLLKQGETWMKTTAESCSITAALIVTVVFAAAITVPGGSNQESGIPLFKKDIAFTIFARPWMLAPISAFACLPISVIATIKLPL